MYRELLLAGLMLSCSASLGWAEKPKTEAAPPNPAAKTAPADQDPATPDATSEEKEDKPAAATPQQLDQLIKELVDPKFATRQAASQKLVQAGKAGMEAVAKAAITEDLELATRCIAVLTEGLASKSEEVKQAATNALQSLTKSENKSVAQRAKQALDAPQLPGIIPGGGRVNQIQVQINNGQRTITVRENGRETVIKDNNGKDISITTTETVNGQKVTTTVTGKDEDDLKKNSPQSFAVYQRFTQRNGIQFQIGMNAIGGNIVIPQARVLRPRIVNPIKAADLFDEVDKLRQKLDATNERLANAAGGEKPDPAELKAISEEIKATTKRLTEIHTESQLP